MVKNEIPADEILKVYVEKLGIEVVNVRKDAEEVAEKFLEEAKGKIKELSDEELKWGALASEALEKYREIFKEELKKRGWKQIDVSGMRNGKHLVYKLIFGHDVTYLDDVLWLSPVHDVQRFLKALSILQNPQKKIPEFLPCFGKVNKIVGKEFAAYTIVPMEELPDEKEKPIWTGVMTYFQFLTIEKDLKEAYDILKRWNQMNDYRIGVITTERLSYVIDTQEDCIRGVFSMTTSEGQLIFLEDPSFINGFVFASPFVAFGKPKEVDNGFYELNGLLVPKELAPEGFENRNFHTGFKMGRFFLPL